MGTGHELIVEHQAPDGQGIRVSEIALPNKKRDVNGLTESKLTFALFAVFTGAKFHGFVTNPGAASA